WTVRIALRTSVSPAGDQSFRPPSVCPTENSRETTDEIRSHRVAFMAAFLISVGETDFPPPPVRRASRRESTASLDGTHTIVQWVHLRASRVMVAKDVTMNARWP